MARDLDLDLQYFCLNVNRLGMYTWSFSKAEIKRYFPQFHKEWMEYKKQKAKEANAR